MNRLLALLGLLFLALPAWAQSEEDLQRQIDNQNFAEARRAATLLLEEKGKKGWPHYYIGLSFLEEALIQEEPEIRLQLLERSKQPFLDGIEARSRYANNHLGLGRYYAYTGKKEKAIAEFEGVYENYADDPLVLADIAYAYIATGDKDLLEQATTLLSRAEVLGSDSPKIYEALGDVWNARGVQELPLANYQRALAKDPKRVTTHHRIGQYYAQYNKYSEAAASFKEVIAIDPNYAPVYPDLGELYFLAQQFDTATEYYRKYVDLRGSDRNARYRFAQFLYLSGQFKEALTQLQQVDTTTRVKMRLLAYCGFEDKQYELAQTNIDALFANSQEKYLIAKDYEYRGKIRLENGEIEKGVEDILRSVEMDSARLDLYEYLVNFFNKKQRDYKMGLRFQQLATAADPSAKSYYKLGYQAYIAKENEIAIEAYKKVVEEKSDFVPAHLYLARTYSRKDTASPIEGLAKPHYEKIIELGKEDQVQYKKELVEAYLYMSIFEFNVNQDYKASHEYVVKLLAVDPEYESGKKLKSQLDDILQQVEGTTTGGQDR